MKHFIIGTKLVDVTMSNLGPEIETPPNVRFGDDRERILGIQWSPNTDVLNFETRINFSKKKRGARSGPDIPEESFDSLFPHQLTLRMYLSQMASLFDPLGLASAFTIIMKHELGRIFALGGHWDDPIPHDSSNEKANHDRCKAIIRMLYDLARVEFPRCLRPMDTPQDCTPVLVMMSDGSQTAHEAMFFSTGRKLTDQGPLGWLAPKLSPYQNGPLY